MKRMSNPMLRGKAALLALGLAAGISMFMSSCKKDDKNSDSAVSQQEVATVVSSAVTNGGVAMQTETAAMVAAGFMGQRQGQKTTDLCGYTDSNSFQLSTDVNGTAISFDYNYTFKLACTADQSALASFGFTFDGKTTLSNATLALSDTSAADFTVTGLDDSSTYLVFNQKFDHSGTYTSKDGSTPSFHSVIKYTAADITVSKTTFKIVSGTAAVAVSGTTTDGKSFSYAGTITYKGSGKATFQITGGGSFDLQW